MQRDIHPKNAIAGTRSKKLYNVATWILSEYKSTCFKKAVIPASKARRESFFKAFGKIPDKPE